MPPAGGEGTRDAPTTSILQQLDQLEAQLDRLGASLAARISGAQEETLQHLQVFQEAVQDLEVRSSAGGTRGGGEGEDADHHRSATSTPPHPHAPTHPAARPQVSAAESAARADELRRAAKRLAVELRGLDLLAGQVKTVKGLVDRLEAAVQQVVAGPAVGAGMGTAVAAMQSVAPAAAGPAALAPDGTGEGFL